MIARALIVVALMLAAAQAEAEMYASTANQGGNVLGTIDESSGTFNTIGTIAGGFYVIVEIEWSPQGDKLYAATGAGASTILRIDPATGDTISSVSQSSPGYLLGMEFDARGDLLAASIPGPGGASTLVRVDPDTGVVTPIGLTGYNHIGGLAFDAGFDTLYGITSGVQGGGTPPILLDVDPLTGAASSIGSVNLGGGTILSSLEFDSQGRLVAGAGNGNYYEIDPVTANATLIGPMVNVPQLSGLSLVTAPPAPVPDGVFGSPMRATKVHPTGSRIDLEWDTSTCPSPGYHVIYGLLSNVASLTASGSLCGLESDGTHLWTGVPFFDVWFLVVGNDGGSVEGSGGVDGEGDHRAGGVASGQCGFLLRNDSAPCPDNADDGSGEAAGPTQRLNADIVIFDGVFTQDPEGMQE